MNKYSFIKGTGSTNFTCGVIEKRQRFATILPIIMLQSHIGLFTDSRARPLGMP